MIYILALAIVLFGTGCAGVLMMGRALPKRERTAEGGSFGETVAIRESIWREYGV